MPRLFIVMLFLLGNILLVQSTQAQIASTQNCVTGDCFDAYGVYEFDAGYETLPNAPQTYSGEFKSFSDAQRIKGNRGLRHGHGICTFFDGSKYSGRWKSDLPNGNGRMNYRDGAMYDGQWRSGKRHGKGLMRYKDGTVVYGKWKHGELKRSFPREWDRSWKRFVPAIIFY